MVASSYSKEEAQRITAAVERLAPELQKQTWDALRGGAVLIWDGDDIVGLAFREEVKDE